MAVYTLRLTEHWSCSASSVHTWISVLNKSMSPVEEKGYDYRLMPFSQWKLNTLQNTK